MALFNRRQQNPANVPAEIQEYYQTERRERAGVAWLLAFGTLVATIALAAGIFFGGRWVYRAAFDKDDPKTEVAQQDQQGEEQSAENRDNNQNAGQTQGQGGASQQPSTPAPAPAPATPPPAPTPAPNPAPVQPAPQSQQPVTGSSDVAADTTSPLPRTGPADVIGISLFVSLAGYLTHRVLTRRQLR